ncbi:hypothetical protein B0T16DRAFT_429189 [Cercophora newfieldiana]|uniref:Uncharacterized protein n=1 Tax=Cercophora newfieldiana TaxID=92897 RepID=A0AA39Y5I9_9PEZI|nr:hypothetical protein B0T16DRAFT_429189 [Cercophora newfieldiana]
MCNFTQREYSCGHFRWIASEWCKNYTLTHKRCHPNVTHFEYKHVQCEELCGDCKPKIYPAWENMIRRRPDKQQTHRGC